MKHLEDIFDRLRADHDKHRDLLARLEQTSGETPERHALFEEFTLEAKGHAAAEEQALYSTVLRKPPLTACGRHSVAEHHEIEEMLNDLAATPMDTGGWLTKFRGVKDKYLHHIKEEETEMFPKFRKQLTEDDVVYMRQVFERRKPVEKSKADITPEKMEEAKD
ncbi:hemerythrin domain-containing protein [Novosphingobium lentum]|uniref:hemerythrin domain-containing protein n=1 Tax=Novosphingobium lentum TaxID=145287 RepID=UPI00082EB100|nr:hemerythrin domain-containing protein [Novosphingobium lentum]